MSRILIFYSFVWKRWIIIIRVGYILQNYTAIVACQIVRVKNKIDIDKLVYNQM